MDHVAAVVDRVLIKRILCNGGVPVKTELLGRIGYWWLDEPAFTGFIVNATYVTLLAHAVYPRRIFSIRHYIKTITATYVAPVIVTDTAIGPGIGRSMPAT